MSRLHAWHIVGTLSLCLAHSGLNQASHHQHWALHMIISVDTELRVALQRGLRLDHCFLLRVPMSTNLTAV